MTAPGGGPCFGPRRSRPSRGPSTRQGSNTSAGGGGGGGGGDRRGSGPKKPRDPFWHEGLSEEVRNHLESKDIRSSTGTLDISRGDARVKLGTNGYSSMAHANGILAEGSFTCDVDGNAAFTWQYVIAYDQGSGAWETHEDRSLLPSSFCLTDGKFIVHWLCRSLLKMTSLTILHSGYSARRSGRERRVALGDPS